MLARFHISRVCGNRPRAALAINENDECYTYTQTDRYRQTDRQTDRHADRRTDRQTDKQVDNFDNATHPGMKKRFCPVSKKRPGSLRFLGRDSLLVERYLRQRGVILAASSVRSKKKTT